MRQEGEGGCKSDNDCAAGLSCTAGLIVSLGIVSLSSLSDIVVNAPLISTQLQHAPGEKASAVPVLCLVGDSFAFG